MTYSPEGLASAIFLSMGLGVRSIGRKIRSSLGRLRREKGAAEERAEAVQAPKLSDEAFSLLKQLSDELGARPAASATRRWKISCGRAGSWIASSMLGSCR